MTIKEYRQGKGMTQAELGAAVGVPQNNVWRWESGAVKPGVETLRKLADIFGCQIDEITPAVKQLKARDIFSRELKKEQNERIPADWWDTYTAQHIGAIMAMLKNAFDDGINYGREHPDC